MVLVSFIHEKNGSQVETVHQSARECFERDDLLEKFKDFMRSLDYVFPGDTAEACPCDRCKNKEPFEIE